MSPSNPEADQKPALGQMPDRFFLTGFMGAGKSTIGSLLAQAIGYKFYDTDKMIIKGFGNKPVSRIYEEHGEEAFRQAENLVIAECCKRKNVVISTGGGTLVREETMGPALASGLVIYLKAPVELLYERVVFSPKDRPILNVPETEQVFREKFTTREAFYNRAHLIVETSDRERKSVVNEIIDRLGLTTIRQAVQTLSNAPTHDSPPAETA